MQNRVIPPWLGLPLGAGLGVLISWQAARGQGEELSAEWVIWGAVLGALAGGGVWIWDLLRRTKKKERQQQ
jgi:hypothetical protein